MRSLPLDPDIRDRWPDRIPLNTADRSSGNKFAPCFKLGQESGAILLYKAEDVIRERGAHQQSHAPRPSIECSQSSKPQKYVSVLCHVPLWTTWKLDLSATKAPFTLARVRQWPQDVDVAVMRNDLIPRPISTEAVQPQFFINLHRISFCLSQGMALGVTCLYDWAS